MLKPLILSSHKTILASRKVIQLYSKLIHFSHRLSLQKLSLYQGYKSYHSIMLLD